jgi:hypothetical protein
VRIRERTEIRRPAEVWPFVIRPENFQKWNTKIASMEPGESFASDNRSPRTTSGKASPCSACRVTLEESRGRTTVTKIVTVRNHGIPWFLMPLIWFVTRLGKPVGPDPLKSLLEGGA